MRMISACSSASFQALRSDCEHGSAFVLQQGWCLYRLHKQGIRNPHPRHRYHVCTSIDFYKDMRTCVHMYTNIHWHLHIFVQVGAATTSLLLLADETSTTTDRLYNGIAATGNVDVRELMHTHKRTQLTLLCRYTHSLTRWMRVPAWERESDRAREREGKRPESTTKEQHTAIHCITLQHIATFCITQQCSAIHYSTPHLLHRTAPHCTTLHHTAAQCNAL